MSDRNAGGSHRKGRATTPEMLRPTPPTHSLYVTTSLALPDGATRKFRPARAPRRAPVAAGRRCQTVAGAFGSTGVAARERCHQRDRGAGWLAL
jgi:hypothetical protein